MNKTASKILWWKLCVCALLFFTQVDAKAQNVQYTAGSSNFQVGLDTRVDPSTLGLNLTIDLGGYSGRQINTPVTIRYNSKLWNVRFSFSSNGPDPNRTYTYTEAFYSETSSSGWSNNLMPPVIIYDDIQNHYDQYGQGVDLNRAGQWNYNDPYFVVPRLRIRTVDGALREFRRGDWVAEFRYGRTNPNIWVGDFYSVDGSKLRYNVEERTLYLPNGGRYTHEPNTNTFNKYIDQNGNVLTYGNNEVIDTLGRPIPAPPGAPTSPQDINYSLPGMNNNTINYVFKWQYLSNSLSGNYPLRYAGDCSFLSQPLSPSLFLGDENDGYVCPSDRVLFNPIVLKEIVLPSSGSYKFTYNVWGEIDKIEYPTGSYERFEYATILGTSSVAYPYSLANRGVIKKWVSSDGNASSEIQWQFGNPYQGNFYTINPDNTKSERTYRTPLTTSGYGFEDERTGAMEEEKFYDSAGAVVRRSLTEYQATGVTGTPPPASGYTSYYPVSYANRDPRPTRSINIVFEPGASHALVTMIESTHDSNSDIGYFAHLNPKTVKNYHYIALDADTARTASLQTLSGYFANATPFSISETDYLYNSSYKSRNIIGLPVEIRSLNPTNPSDILSRNQSVYDEQGQYYSMVDYGSTTGYEAPTGTSAHLRGNPTTTRTWNKDTNTWTEYHTQYDNFGNVRKVWGIDGDQNRYIETDYDSFYKYAYPTKVKNPGPDPTGIHGASESSEVSTSYDFKTGLFLSITDTNGQIITREYDNLLRPKKIIPPAGAAISETIYSSDINNPWIKVRQQIDETHWAERTTFFDKLSRPYKTQTKDLQGDIFTEIKYDNLGRVERVSNPYRQGDPIYWSKTRYDNQNRAVETYAPALEGQQAISIGTAEFGISAISNLVGYVVTAKGASGRKNRTISNLYGILRLDEPTGSGGTSNNDLGTLESPHQPTFYHYNLKGELVKIVQGNPAQSGAPLQNRYFMYDSSGRLIRVRQSEQTPNPNLATTGNPENNQWTTGFAYDIFNNVISVTDAKGTVITNDYDKAGRAKTTTYSDGTPTISYFYDGKGLGLSQPLSFARGSLTKISNGISETRYTSFDNLGRTLASQQITDGQTYTFGYKYDSVGNLIEQTYPSLRVVKTHLDTGGGLAAVSSKTANTPYRAYASNFDYTATGAVKAMMLGNGRWETAQFNPLSQLTQMGLGNSATDTSLWKVNYEYGELNSDGTTVDSTKSIGSIAKQTITLPTTSFVQTYKYDELSRLTEARETTNGSQNWKQTFGYDRYGNRTAFSQIIGSTQLPINNLTHPTIDPNTNRFATGQGYVYDFNGNLVQDAQNRSFTFNGDDKQTVVRDLNIPTTPQNPDANVIGRYYYDGLGQRVKKVTNTETTIFVYDDAGTLAAEYSTVAPPTPTTSYLTTDHLGSPRVITDKQGSVTSRRDFMPFGEELLAGVGTRTTAQKYSATGIDNIRQRFTGYEKDAETELDFAEARMYQNRHGRFTVPDPLLASASLSNPQTFNRYVYTGNNPINLTDPSGLSWCRKEGGNETEFTGKDQPCKDGWENIDGTVGVIRAGDWSKERARIGDVVRFNSDGTVTVLDPNKKDDQLDYAKATGTLIEAGPDPVQTDPPNGVIEDIMPRPPQDPLAVPCAPFCSNFVPLPTIDTSKNPPLKTVAVIEAISEIGSAAPIVGTPFALIKTIIDFGQGDFWDAGENSIGIIPGMGIFSKLGKLSKLGKIPKLNDVVDVAKDVLNSKWVRKNVFGKIPATGQNIRPGFQILGGRFKYMVHQAHPQTHTRPHYQIEVYGRDKRKSLLKIRKPIGDRWWKWTRGAF